MTDLLLKDEVYAIIGAAIRVHRELGSGFLEAVYHEALTIELEDHGIPFESQKPLPITRATVCKRSTLRILSVTTASSLN